MFWCSSVDFEALMGRYRGLLLRTIESDRIKITQKLIIISIFKSVAAMDFKGRGRTNTLEVKESCWVMTL